MTQLLMVQSEQTAGPSLVKACGTAAAWDLPYFDRTQDGGSATRCIGTGGNSPQRMSLGAFSRASRKAGVSAAGGSTVVTEMACRAISREMASANRTIPPFVAE